MVAGENNYIEIQCLPFREEPQPQPEAADDANADNAVEEAKQANGQGQAQQDQNQSDPNNEGQRDIDDSNLPVVNEEQAQAIHVGSQPKAAQGNQEEEKKAENPDGNQDREPVLEIKEEKKQENQEPNLAGNKIIINETPKGDEEVKDCCKLIKEDKDKKDDEKEAHAQILAEEEKKGGLDSATHREENKKE